MNGSKFGEKFNLVSFKLLAKLPNFHALQNDLWSLMAKELDLIKAF